MDSKVTSEEIEEFFRQGKMVRERNERVQRNRDQNSEQIEYLSAENKKLESTINNIKAYLQKSTGKNDGYLLEGIQKACRSCDSLMNK